MAEANKHLVICTCGYLLFSKGKNGGGSSWQAGADKPPHASVTGRNGKTIIVNAASEIVFTKKKILSCLGWAC